jgi:hypothetical protein
MEKKFKITCNICFDLETDSKCSECTFECCDVCLLKWLKKTHTCPQCRKVNTFDVSDEVSVDEVSVDDVSDLSEISDDEDDENVHEELYTFYVELFTRHTPYFSPSPSPPNV